MYRFVLLFVVTSLSAALVAQEMDQGHWVGKMEMRGESSSKGSTDLRSLAEHGDPVAQNTVDLKYYAGLGVKQSYAEAVKWFRKAAEQGYADAQNNLGLMYARGHGVAQSDTEATKWIRKAAEQGNADAQNNLGVMYANGHGVRLTMAWSSLTPRPRNNTER